MIRARRKLLGGIVRARFSEASIEEDFFSEIQAQGERPERLERKPLAGLDVVVKTEDLRGKVPLRYALRRTAREREFDNLTWLQGKGFRVPQPLAAGALLRRGLPRRQWLITRFVTDAIELGRFAGEVLDTAERAAVYEALAAEIARMHDAGFVHRDLYSRNLLVSTLPSEDRRPFLLDAWRGGPGFGLRGPAWDLGCLLSERRMLFAEDEQAAFKESYVRLRPKLHRQARAEAFWTKVEAARSLQVARAERRAGRRAEERGHARQDSNLRPSD
ncbi:MAG: lipopolysaccharide kinase InaA family protein [Planctomycetota bacterium]